MIFMEFTPQLQNCIQQATNYFHEGFNCAQSVFSAFAPLYGINTQDALKLSCSFGGGMGRMREVCGTVSAMSMIISLETGNTNPTDETAKANNYAQVRELAEQFRSLHGSIICRDLLQLDMTSYETEAAPSKRTQEYYQSRPCTRFIKDAAIILATWIMNNSHTC